MLDRAWGGSFRRSRDGHHPDSRKPSRCTRRPQVEGLEGRQLLAASIAPIADVTVPALVGYQVPIDGSASGATQQTFTVTSSNPTIKATVARGDFVTVNVTHTASSTPGDTSFSGSYVYQLFSDLTPNTASRIEKFTNGALPGVTGSYNGTTFFRIATNFDPRRPAGEATNTVLQGGPPDTSPAASGTSPLELNQQLAFVQPGTVAIAHSAANNTDGQQFFITTGAQANLAPFGYTIFGQVITGEDLLQKIASVPTTVDPLTGFPTPNSPVTITSETVSKTSPDGVIHVDATGATAGATSVITVTATDPATHTTAMQSFHVTVAAAAAVPATATFPPTTLAPSPASQTIGSGQSAVFQAPFNSNNLTANSAVTTSYALVTPPAHGSVAFNTTAKTAVYTPAPNFTGTDTFSYRAVNNNSTAAANPTAAPGNTVTATVTVVPSSLRVIAQTLVFTPPPRTDGGTNTIVVSQVNNTTTPANDKLVVTLNGVADLSHPLVSAIKRIVIYGSKANDQITVSPGVSSAINVTLDGGHGGKNTLQAGAGNTREHGWFGQNTLAGGTGPNQLIGRAGHVKFKPTATTNEIFAGTAHPGSFQFRSFITRVSNQVHPTPGTFYKFVHGQITPIATPRANRVQTTTTTTNQRVTKV